MLRVAQFTCLTLLLVCLIGGCNIGGAGTKSSRTDKAVQTAADKRKAQLKKQIDRKFENPNAHYELGQIYQADGLWSQAETEYNTTLSFAPAHRDAQAGLIRVLLDKGDKTRSAGTADVHIKQVAASPAESFKLGLAFQTQKLDDYAVTCYQQALNLAPNSYKVNRQLGFYYLAKGDRARAREFLSRSFQLNPHQPDVAGELGKLGVSVKVQPRSGTSSKDIDRMVE